MVWHGVHLVCALPKLLALAPSWAHSPRGLHDHVPMQLLCLSLSLCRSLLPPDLFSVFGLECRIHQNTTCVSEVLKLSTWVCLRIESSLSSSLHPLKLPCRGMLHRTSHDKPTCFSSGKPTIFADDLTLKEQLNLLRRRQFGGFWHLWPTVKMFQILTYM